MDSLDWPGARVLRRPAIVCVVKRVKYNMLGWWVLETHCERTVKHHDFLNNRVAKTEVTCLECVANTP